MDTFEAKNTLNVPFCSRMFRYFDSVASPVVPHKNTGLRITVTLHQSLEDIQNMLCQLAQLLESEEIEQQVSRNDIFRAFGMKL